MPRLPLMKAPVNKPKLDAADWLAGGWIASAAGCLGGAFFWPVLAVSAVGSLATAGALAFGPAGKKRRDDLAARDAVLGEKIERLVAEARAVAGKHGQRKAEYDAYAANVTTGVGRYQAETEDLQTILQQLRIEQRRRLPPQLHDPRLPPPHPGAHAAGRVGSSSRTASTRRTTCRRTFSRASRT